MTSPRLTHPHSFPSLLGQLLVLGAAGSLVACGTDQTRSDDGEGFISHVPGSSGDRSGAEGGDASADGGDGDGDGGSEEPPTGERAIAEADIIQRKGDLLFALSSYSGLSVVNVADPSNLRLVGNYRSSATPFEMYLEGDTAYVMYNGWYSYFYDESADSYRWDTTSRMQAIDVSDPTSPSLIGDMEVPGRVVDSRKVGDVIYLATQEDGYCWNCEQMPNVQVTSFNVADPSQFTPVDRLVFQNDESWTRSISVSQERIYVAGWTWDAQNGSIDVVDISDPSGELVAGDTISIAGQIESRWQMDEHEGTLRVISQPGGWGTTNPPVVETFQINSSSNITKLASLDMVLPRPEDLRSVRFDGTRAFAITFERTDPLFTFDLSVPSAPKQIGELEIPGWVYHMEPRGDRVYALGFDEENAAGSLHVSLFDVSDLANPTQIDRVNFGGDWANFAEDQDRIHKAFNILSDEGLILVPFSGGSYEEESCHYEYQSGIQLVDMTTDTLTLRGVAPQVGSARRALLLDDTLLGVTDNAIQAFDISDRDAPTELDQLDVARNVSSIRLMGSTMLRFGTDWWTNQTVLDFASLNKVESAEGLGALDLESLVEPFDESCENKDGSYYYSYANWGGQVFVHGNFAYVPRYTSEYGENNGTSTDQNTLTFFIVDISERTAPRLIGTFEVEPTLGKSGEYYAGIVQTDSALLVGRHRERVLGVHAEREFFYDVIDLSGGDELEVVERFEVPASYATGGFGYGMSGCMIDVGWGWWGGNYGSTGALVSGDIVVSQHEVPLSDGSGRVRYYMDRIDVSNPASPKMLPKVNIPGKVVHFDGEADRITTIDYLLETKKARKYEDCYADNFYGYFDEEARECRTYRRRLNVLELDGDTARLIDSKDIDGDLPAQSIAISDSRIFYNKVNWSESGASEHEVHTLKVGSSGNLTEMPVVDLSNRPYWWGSLVARDGRAFMTQENELTVVDASGSTPKVETHEMGGWWCESLEVQNDVAYCAMGAQGVRAFPLGE